MRLLLAAAILACSPVASTALTSSLGNLTVQSVVSGLDEPWGFGFLPEGGVLITERAGSIVHVTPGGTAHRVSGGPDVFDNGQGGLLDILVPRDFAETRSIYLTYAIAQGRGAGTALGVGTLSADGKALTGFRTLFESKRGSTGGRHFGSRVVEGGDGALYLTIGDRGDDDSAQDLSNQNGSVVRIMRDGQVPGDNPFVGTATAQPEIWSFGHRNPQGAAVDRAGQVWVVEHGARGGDEVNRIQRGANYGWPIISYGTHYSGFKIGEGTQKPGMEQPAHYWDPSIAPSGMVFYSGAMFPEWQGDLFIGSLKFGLISRLDVEGRSVREAERLQSDETGRVRDIRQAPDGSIWYLSVTDGALYRISR